MPQDAADWVGVSAVMLEEGNETGGTLVLFYEVIGVVKIVVIFRFLGILVL